MMLCISAYDRYYYINLWSNKIMCVECPKKVKVFQKGDVAKRGNITKICHTKEN